MALDYTDLFTLRLKSIITGVNTMLTWYSDLDTIDADIRTKMVSANSENLLGTALGSLDSSRANVNSAISLIASLANNTLTDRDTILNELPKLTDNSVSAVVSYLVKQMNVDSENVAASTVTIGSVTTTVTNTNAGSLFTSKKLDGVSAPAYYARANREYADLDSQISLTSDTLNVICVEDSESDNTPWGKEQFFVTGKPQAPNLLSWLSKGSGGATRVQTAQGASFYDLGFDAFTSNLPDGWTAVSGTAGTHFLEETVEVVNTGSSLEIAGNCELSFPVASSSTPLSHILCGFLIKSDGLVSGATLNIFLEGTGYTTEASTVSEIVMDATALNAQTSFGIEYFNEILPTVVPDNLTIRIEVTGMSAGKIYIDFGYYSRPVYHDGIAVMPIAGREVFLRDDSFVFNVTNNDAGEYQKFFRDVYGVQLPTDGTPSIAY